MNIQELIEEAHATSKDKGWHDPEVDTTFGERIALIHSELSEALEEYRNGHDYDLIYYESGKGKPEGIPIELADAVIRIFDMCGKYGIDLDAALKIKMEYNKTRPHRHGGKKI